MQVGNSDEIRSWLPSLDLVWSSPVLGLAFVLAPSSTTGVSVNTEIHRNTLETPKYTEIHYSACTYPPKYTHN